MHWVWDANYISYIFISTYDESPSYTAKYRRIGNYIWRAGENFGWSVFRTNLAPLNHKYGTLCDRDSLFMIPMY